MKNLKNLLKGKVVILCVGSRDRGDDGAGPFLADILKGRTSHEVIDAGIAPENYTAVISRANPDTILIVDAVCFQAEPGEAKIFSNENLREGKISTHDSSPKLLIDYLKNSTKADIYIIGIKPKSNRMGTPLTEEVKQTIKKIADFISK